MEGRVFSDLILEVKRGRIDGFVTYRFAFGGFFWVFFVSNQVPGLPWSGLFVKEDGTLTIAKPDLKKTGFLERLARSFGETLVSP